MNSGTGNCVFALTLLLIAICEGAKLPSYLTQCSRNDKDINGCFLRNANLGIPAILNGDKKLKIPSLLPLKINEVKINPSASFQLTMRNIQVFGLDGAVVTKANVNLETHKIQLVVEIPRVELIGDYEINGRVLVLPIEGKGPANITLVNGKYMYRLELELFDKKGEQYSKISDHSITLDSERTYYQFDNLFNGNKELGDQMNKFLNENYVQVGRDIGPAVSETISVVITSIIAAVLKVVSYKNLFL